MLQQNWEVDMQANSKLWTPITLENVYFKNIKWRTTVIYFLKIENRHFSTTLEALASRDEIWQDDAVSYSENKWYTKCAICAI